MSRALDETFAALAEANRTERKFAPLSALTIGLQCGGSDGFSGISANPAVGHVSDLLVGVGGKTILSEFPELHGVEQELINRCATDALAQRFRDLMQAYQTRARAVNSGFEMNPSPGNIATASSPTPSSQPVRRAREAFPLSAASSTIQSTSPPPDSACSARRVTTWRA